MEPITQEALKVLKELKKYPPDHAILEDDFRKICKPSNYVGCANRLKDAGLMAAGQSTRNGVPRIIISITDKGTALLQQRAKEMLWRVISVVIGASGIAIALIALFKK